LSDKRPAHAFHEFKTPETITAVGAVPMNKTRGLLFHPLIALVSSSICWSQGIAPQRASQTTDLCAHQMITTQPRAGKAMEATCNSIVELSGS
jgi:hypothetical protein